MTVDDDKSYLHNNTAIIAIFSSLKDVTSFINLLNDNGNDNAAH
jgi:hypothetical protein